MSRTLDMVIPVLVPPPPWQPTTSSLRQHQKRNSFPWATWLGIGLRLLWRQLQRLESGVLLQKVYHGAARASTDLRHRSADDNPRAETCPSLPSPQSRPDQAGRFAFSWSHCHEAHRFLADREERRG